MTAAAVSDGVPLHEAEAVVAQLRQAGLTGADASPLARGMYSSDASLYRVVPLAVVRPGHVDELQGIHEVAQSLGV
ncbi:MAG TPA: hypothetical protein H9871_06760, partial [Candidatus Nesterenkonia stercoripullorum]|nr:hypothetical protein [Candidatus Nesterenkonia stercoripullorum]